MKAIISPYEEATEREQIVLVPSVVVDLGGADFNSSDIPEEILFSDIGERLILMDSADHARAVALGYVEVTV